MDDNFGSPNAPIARKSYIGARNKELSQSTPELAQYAPNSSQDIKKEEPAPTEQKQEAVIDPDAQVVLTDSGDIKYATQEFLIDLLFSESQGNPEYVLHFILAMNFFIEPSEFYGVLMQRLNSVPSDREKKLVLSVLNTWISIMWTPSTDKSLIRSTEALAKSIPWADFGKIILDSLNEKTTPKKVLKNYDAINDGIENSTGAPIPLAFRIIEITSEKPEINFWNTNLEEIARQLTLVEHHLFNEINPGEFQNLNFSKKDKSFAPNISVSSQHLNTVVDWFKNLIMSESDLHKRAEVIKSIIELGAHFYALKNYNGMMEVAAALLSSSIDRLHKTWNELPQRYMAKFESIKALASNTKNFSALREAIASSKPPLVPYIGMYQSDLTFLEDGNPTTARDGTLINWQKCKLQAKILLEIRSKQIVPYKLTPISWMQDFFMNLQVDVTDDYLWNKSLEYEPKPVSSSAFVTSQMAASSGFSSMAISSTLTSALSPSLSSSSELGLNGQTDEANLSNLARNNTFKFLLRGQATFIRIPFPLRCFEYGVSGLKLIKHIYKYLRDNNLAPRSLSDESREQENITLVLFSGAYRYGVEFVNDQKYSLVYLHSEKAFLTGLRDVRNVEVVFPVKTGPAHSAWFKADGDSPLFSLVVAINSAFSNTDEFMMVRVPVRGERKWLNVNLTLNQQEFGPNDKIIVVFTSTFATRVFTEKNKKEISDNPDNKVGYLTKHNIRLYTRNAKSTYTIRQRFDESTINLEDPKFYSSQKQLLLSSQATLSSSTLKSEKSWFLVTDSLFYYFKDHSSTSPRRVWALEYCSIAIEYIHRSPILIIRMPTDYPFKLERSPVVYLSCRNDAELHGWYDMLQKRSKRGYNTALFGVSMDLVSARPTAESFFPIQIRRCMDQLLAHGLGIENLFTATPPQVLIDKYREIIESGGYPTATSYPNDYIALAYIIKTYYAEIPEPLITYEMCSSALKDVELRTEASKFSIMALVAALPSPAMFGLLYLVTLLCAWASVSGSIQAAAKVLSQFIAAGCSVDEKDFVENSVIYAEELLVYVNSVLIPNEKCVFKQRSAVIFSKDMNIPITLFTQPELDVLSRMITSSIHVSNAALTGPSLSETTDPSVTDVVVLSDEDDDDDENDKKSENDKDKESGSGNTSKKNENATTGVKKDDDNDGNNDTNVSSFESFISIQKRAGTHGKHTDDNSNHCDYSFMEDVVLSKDYVNLMMEMDKKMNENGEEKVSKTNVKPPEYAPLVNASLDAFLIAKKEGASHPTPPSKMSTEPPKFTQNSFTRKVNTSSSSSSSSSSTAKKFRGLIQ